MLPRVHQTMGAAAARILGGGQTATLRIASSTFDESTLRRSTTYVDYAVPVVVHRLVQQGDGSVIASEQVRISIPALALPAGVAPAKDSLVVFNGITHRIVADEVVTANGSVPVTYDLDIAPVAGATAPAT